MKDTLLDLWDTVRYWVEDNKQIAVGILIIIAFIGFIIFMYMPKPESSKLIKNSKPNTLEEVKEMKDVTESLDEDFSILDERKEGSQEKYPAYNLSLYMKKPFMNEDDLKKDIEKLIEIYKWKTDYNLSGMKIQLYDRKEVFEKDYLPRTTIYYSWKITEDAIKEEDEGGTFIYGDDIQDITYQDTIEAGKKPEYEEYVLDLGQFQQMKNDESITPLSDQEFSFYLKMHLYNELKEGSDYGGARMYLQWDLGRSLTKDGITAIVKEFREFQDRHLKLNGQREYIENLEFVKRDLAKESPQFLLFAETGEIVDDPLDAQKKLIEFSSGIYTKPLEDYIEEKSQDITDEVTEQEEERKEQEKKEKEKEIEFEYDNEDKKEDDAK